MCAHHIRRSQLLCYLPRQMCAQATLRAQAVASRHGRMSEGRTATSAHPGYTHTYCRKATFPWRP
jgi:hypothetical protein